MAFYKTPSSVQGWGVWVLGERIHILIENVLELCTELGNLLTFMLCPSNSWEEFAVILMFKDLIVFCNLPKVSS